MHVLVTKYFDYPVAVNDLGWVAFKNKNYVLDLWGLGSEEARKLTKSGGIPPETMYSLANKKNIKFAMIYREWFPQGVPKQWCYMGQLHTSRVTAASNKVEIFLTDLTLKDEMTEALKKWKQQLPTGAKVSINDDCTYKSTIWSGI